MSNVIAYPAPPMIPASYDFTVKANGVPVFAYATRVSAMATDQIFRGKQRPLDETEMASFVNFAADGPIEMFVKSGYEIFCAKVRPSSKNVIPTWDIYHDTVSFTLPGPGHYTLEINGYHRCLHIFVDPIAENRPDITDPNVIYVAPGTHNLGRITLTSNQTLFVDAGAWVYGEVFAENAENIRICGRGVLDGCNTPRTINDTGIIDLIQCVNCSNVTIEDIVLIDSAINAISLRDCHDIQIENSKMIGLWRYNSDGLHLRNCYDAVIRRCFIRSFDDSLVYSSDMGHYDLANILAEDCVIWNDWGRALEIGAGTFHPVYNITFRNIDVIHFTFIACDVQCCGDAEVRDITFEDIRVEEPLDPHVDPRLMEIFISKQCWGANQMVDRKCSFAHDIQFKDISYNGQVLVPCRFIGSSPESNIDKVSIEKVTVNGLTLPAEGLMIAPIIYNDFADNIYVDGKLLDKSSPHVHYESEEETCSSFLIGNGAFINMRMPS